MSQEELKKFRVMLKFTQRQLADKLGLSIQQISNYETGRNPIPKMVALAIKQLFSDKAGPYGGLSNLTAGERGLLENFVSRLRKKLGDKIVLITFFGSKARGDFSQESDIDILFVLTTLTPTIRHQIYKILFQVDPYYDAKISPIIYSLNDFQKNEQMCSPFIFKIKKEGVML